MLLEKFEVPSNGSTTQNSDPRSSVIPASSDNIGNFEENIIINDFNTKIQLQPENVDIDDLDEFPVKQIYIEFKSQSNNTILESDILLKLDGNYTDYDNFVINTLNNNKFEILIFIDFTVMDINIENLDVGYCIRFNDLTGNIKNPIKIKIN